MVEYQLDGDLETNHKGQIATGARACLPSLEVRLFCCLEVKRRLVCVCFSGSVCVCQHRRLSRGDGRPPADSQRANYGIIRRERGHMCGAAATPTTHTRYGALVLEGVSLQKRGVPKVPRARPHTYRIPLRRC